MSPKLEIVILPDGLEIFCLNKRETLGIYSQIEAYFKHGIRLRPGDTVFDLGANVGLFTLSAYRRCREDVTVYAFEPIPDIFAALACNAQRHGPGRLNAFPWGISDRCGSVRFAYYPHASVTSTAYPDDPAKERARYKRVVLDSQHAQETAPLFFRLMPAFLRPLILDLGLRMAFRVRSVTCPVVTVSHLIREHSIDQIDLLKIDVEKSEMDALCGIEDSDWPKIKQVVIEVHHRDNSLEEIQDLLKQRGFDEITIEQDPNLKGMQVSTLYALRATNRSGAPNSQEVKKHEGILF